MTERCAMDTMSRFFAKFANEGVVFFSCLDDEDKLGYVLIDSFRYFRKFLSKGPALRRAISNAAAHQDTGFKNFDVSGASHFTLR